MGGTDMVKSIDIIQNLNDNIDILMLETENNSSTITTIDEDDVEMNVDASIEKIKEDIEKKISENLYSSLVNEIVEEFMVEEVENILIGYKIVDDLINENIS